MEFYVPSLQAVKVELARRSLGHYVELTSNIELHRWQWDMCEILERFLSEKGLRLAIHGPPQFGKSIVLTKRLPAWLLGHEPDRREVVSAYNVTHATTLTSVVRDVMRSPLHRTVFPNRDGELVEPSSESEFFTRLRFSRLDSQQSVRAVGLQSGFVGSGADDLYMDDPYASAEDARSQAINSKTCRFWSETAKPRVPDTSNVALMFHRYTPGDIAGVLLATGKWEEFRFPAIAEDADDGTDPTRVWRMAGEPLSPIRSLEWLKEIEEEDPETFAGQFQGRPRSARGGLFTEDMFETVETDEVPNCSTWVRFWDPASGVKQGNDHYASALAGVDSDLSIVVRDVTRWKREWPDARDGVWSGKPYAPGSTLIQPGLLQIVKSDLEMLEEESKKRGFHKPPNYLVGLATRGMGLPMFQDLTRNQLFLRIPLYSIDETGDKKQRASVWAARGKMRPIRLERGAWNDGFVKRTIDFRGDGTSPDDEQDALSGVMALLYQYEGNTREKERIPRPGTPEYYAALAKANRAGRR